MFASECFPRNLSKLAGEPAMLAAIEDVTDSRRWKREIMDVATASAKE